MDLNELKLATENGKRKIAKSLVAQAIEEGLEPKDILQAMLDAMEVVGTRFKNNEIFVPEMLVAAAAMKNGMGLLEPLLVKAGIKPEHKAVIGTVSGDLHDIGKNLVIIMLKGANFEVVDLGVDVSPQTFVAAIEEHEPCLLALSALLTTTMPAIKPVIDAVRDAGYTELPVIVGGAPLTRDFANSVGATGYAEDAASAVEEANRILATA